MTAISSQDSITLEVKAKLSELQETLIGQHPKMPNLLREIHKTLKVYPEQVTILSEEEIAIIFQALEKQTGVFLAESVSKSAKGKNTTVMAAIKAKGADAF